MAASNTDILNYTKSQTFPKKQSCPIETMAASNEDTLIKTKSQTFPKKQSCPIEAMTASNEDNIKQDKNSFKKTCSIEVIVPMIYDNIATLKYLEKNDVLSFESGIFDDPVTNEIESD